jgi:hypothetical protein
VRFDRFSITQRDRTRGTSSMKPVWDFKPVPRLLRQLDAAGRAADKDYVVAQ